MKYYICHLEALNAFYYEKGFEYKLSVKKKLQKDPPQDSGNVIYILIEVLSKEKQEWSNEIIC